MSLDRTLNLGAAAKPEARISEKCFLPRGSSCADFCTKKCSLEALGSTPHLHRGLKMLRWKSFATSPPESFAGFRLERGDDGKDSPGADFGHLEER